MLPGLPRASGGEAQPGHCSSRRRIRFRRDSPSSTHPTSTPSSRRTAHSPTSSLPPQTDGSSSRRPPATPTRCPGNSSVRRVTGERRSLSFSTACRRTPVARCLRTCGRCSRTKACPRRRCSSCRRLLSRRVSFPRLRSRPFVHGSTISLPMHRRARLSCAGPFGVRSRAFPLGLRWSRRRWFSSSRLQPSCGGGRRRVRRRGARGRGGVAERLAAPWRSARPLARGDRNR